MFYGTPWRRLVRCPDHISRADPIAFIYAPETKVNITPLMSQTEQKVLSSAQSPDCPAQQNKAILSPAIGLTEA
jgi:hypothetical protein